MKSTYCKTLAKQGGHGPGWQRSVHLWEHTFCWLSSWDDEDDELFFNGFPHTSPQEWGVSRRSYAGSITFPQKHRYSRGAVLRTNWHPGHLRKKKIKSNEKKDDKKVMKWKKLTKSMRKTHKIATKNS